MYFVVVLTFIAFSLVTIAAFSLQTSQLVTDVVSEVPLTVILLLVLCHPTRRTYRNRAASLALFTVLTLPFQKNTTCNVQLYRSLCRYMPRSIVNSIGHWLGYTVPHYGTVGSITSSSSILTLQFVHYIGWAKKRVHRLMTIILSNLNWFTIFVTGRVLGKFAVKCILKIPLHLAYVTLSNINVSKTSH